MILATALAAAAVAPTSPEKLAESAAAAQIYREGCVEGALNMTKHPGRALKPNELTTFVQTLDWGRSLTAAKVIRFKYPRSTYLIFGTYRDVQPKGIRSVCMLLSLAITHADATAAFRAGTPDIEPIPRYVPDMYFPEWTIDQPKLGYRKRLEYRPDDSVVIEVAMYANSQKPSRSEEEK